jgi:hypothetical protein
MHVCLLCAFIFPAIESSEECAEEGEVFEYQEEEDEGQAIKASHLLVAYLNPNISPCIVLLLFYYYALFLYCYYSLYSNSWRLSSTSRLDIIYRDDTLDTYTTPLY